MQTFHGSISLLRDAVIGFNMLGGISPEQAVTGYAYETIPNKAIIAGKTKGPEDSAEQPTPLGRLALGRR